MPKIMNSLSIYSVTAADLEVTGIWDVYIAKQNSSGFTATYKIMERGEDIQILVNKCSRTESDVLKEGL